MAGTLKEERIQRMIENPYKYRMEVDLLPFKITDKS